MGYLDNRILLEQLAALSALIHKWDTAVSCRGLPAFDDRQWVTVEAIVGEVEQALAGLDAVATSVQNPLIAGLVAKSQQRLGVVLEELRQISADPHHLIGTGRMGMARTGTTIAGG